jgi:phosphate transport system protein
MDRHFLDELKQRLLLMGGFAENALQQATWAISQNNGKAAQRVIDEEVVINKLQIEIDIRLVQLVARYQLLATDLHSARAAIYDCMTGAGCATLTYTKWFTCD